MSMDRTYYEYMLNKWNAVSHSTSENTNSNEEPYQNSDGSLTDLGCRHYGINRSNSNVDRYSKGLNNRK